MIYSKDRPLRLMVVDDSSTIRRMISMKVDADPRITVVGEAADPFEAREKIKKLAPDILTLDIEMPGMDGLEFLSRVMRLRPMPVVMVSTLTRDGSISALRALSLGAIECVDKRHILHPEEARTNLAELLLHAGSARLRPRVGKAEARRKSSDFDWNGRFAVIGSSTGGVDALTEILAHMPRNCPPIVIAQHMPALFLESFTERLNSKVAPRVVPARAAAPLEQGQVQIAPGGDNHVLLKGRETPRIALERDAGATYVPLIDKLFNSAAAFGSDGVGVILTGMGRDGAQGLSAMKAAGALTIAESEDTAVVDGMPRAARKTGNVDRVCRIEKVAEAILSMTSASRRESAE